MTKKISTAITLSAILGAIVLAALAAVGWWRAWMYLGWIGPPVFLHQLLATGGEASYDTTLAEMFVITLLSVLVLLAFLRKPWLQKHG